MEPFSVTLPRKSRWTNWKARVVLVLTSSTLYFIVMFTFQRIWPSSYGLHETAGTIVVRDAIESLFWGICMSLFDWGIRCDDATLTIDEFKISVGSGLFRRSVRRGEVRTLRELPATFFRSEVLLISKYGPFGTRMNGCILIPKSLPQYEEIKQLVSGWIAPQP